MTDNVPLPLLVWAGRRPRRGSFRGAPWSRQSVCRECFGRISVGCVVLLAGEVANVVDSIRRREPPRPANTSSRRRRARGACRSSSTTTVPYASRSHHACHRHRDHQAAAIRRVREPPSPPTRSPQPSSLHVLVWLRRGISPAALSGRSKCRPATCGVAGRLVEEARELGYRH